MAFHIVLVQSWSQSQLLYTHNPLEMMSGFPYMILNAYDILHDSIDLSTDRIESVDKEQLASSF